MICGFRFFGAPCPALKELCITVQYVSRLAHRRMRCCAELRLTPQDVYRCRLGPYTAAALEEDLGCSFSDETAEAARCYFARQRSICLGSQDQSRAVRYKNLFSAPSTSELQQQFWDIVGDSFVNIPPALQAAFAQVNKISSNDVFTSEAANICDESLRNSMSLDEIILACVFSFFESFCGVPPEEGEFSTFVNELKWDLPDVPWSWDYNPPPPPPLGPNSPAALYARMDPDGFELVREKLLECFPKLTYVASMTGGSVSGVATSEDGLGYGPIYRPTRYSFSTAFLATEGFLDTDSLAARMIQARFTGYFRFGCRSFLEFMADPANAAAGSNAPAGSQQSNPDDFDSRFDRNIMLIATILFAESYGIETRGGVYPIDPLQLWYATDSPDAHAHAHSHTTCPQARDVRVPQRLPQRGPDEHVDVRCSSTRAREGIAPVVVSSRLAAFCSQSRPRHLRRVRLPGPRD